MSYQYATSYSTSKDEKPLTKMWQRLVRQSQYDAKGKPRTRLAILRRRLLTIPTAVFLLCFFVLLWGERSSFSSSIDACKWDKWETWPSDAQPHRIALIADPQLVDPHTYPGRPWPLSSLTIAATDKYIKRSYYLLQRQIDPDTTLFLGDLFDGGREWSTHFEGFQASEKQWKKYGDKYWLNEYNRFGKIFFAQDQVTGGLPAHKVKKFVASLPGNHDLGFGNGVQVPVRNRYQAYFGEGDRIDIVGNHTFVSIDAVSLSAMGQPDSSPELWNSTMQFLDNAQHLKHKAVRAELNEHQGLISHKRWAHEVTSPLDLGRQSTKEELAKELKPEFPTILLSHVPLYRPEGTPCGPLREKFPPTKPDLKHDKPNAIRIAGGYQYQNVLTQELSTTVAEKIGNIGHAFSGDDHDYCEVLHPDYASRHNRGIREITVKSISWAMGVRKPGFQLVSLWNPVDTNGESLRDGPTLQTHLCLLPDQLSIFIRYGILAAFSIIALAMNTLVQVRNEEAAASLTATHTLPTSEPSKSTSKSRSRAPSGATNSMSSSEHSNSNSTLSARTNNARTRSVSPAMGYGLPTARPGASLIEKAGYYGNNPEYQMYNKEEVFDESDDWGNPIFRKPPRPKVPKTFRRKLVDRFGRDFAWAGGPAFVLYYWLLTRG
ncbi:hypothetical protein AUEXF2481DRAFT_31075 [Aureobasidium subglaciale EXF-2481]|uniref:Calcineurin-like phosphoesterase domain-containing protein n=1 Tax=Aureobasidium subglaciale (strain EXF-2481) TaxID=1043005 RepID=A0A074Y705_AURSE|nr:uncharacterized protein AUEXF2481DRAFT_31075 [Aureobasidium subglaciale EXF-2481]KAI5212736.1 hypothetical protein E4T38_00190 [Aureobasidium subglaciale]KAI5232346.1 hypothetical protein E4T40_00189 [Aureobasidium subglaciale]KAI5234678.1 hypothetical protein E4T41_00189 [Aureobasidium subglaciale]KAI5268507.1 hypothetical protein E4T46_00189 [Aureobasidium subglaciale]KEQ93495.1 hypothetical protein AUEXF2481DRAFT_31075 [Aureobasidium subglaciale EXF-2481]